MYSYPPPVPPPKPDSHEASRMGTPSLTQSPRPPPNPDSRGSFPEAIGTASGAQSRAQLLQQQQQQQPQQVEPDPGDQWLPRYLEDKAKQDLAEILGSGALLSALTHSAATIHPSLRASHDTLSAALADNVDLAAHLLELEARVSAQRAGAQARLLSTHALERQWRARQRDADRALAPFAPAGLYQRLAQGVQEQEAVCLALEESFLDGGGGAAGGGDGGVGGGGAAHAGVAAADGAATEREVADWVRRYREAKKLYYLRLERKARWDEGRVGGWR